MLVVAGMIVVQLVSEQGSAVGNIVTATDTAAEKPLSGLICKENGVGVAPPNIEAEAVTRKVKSAAPGSVTAGVAGIDCHGPQPVRREVAARQSAVSHALAAVTFIEGGARLSRDRGTVELVTNADAGTEGAEEVGDVVVEEDAGKDVLRGVVGDGLVEVVGVGGWEVVEGDVFEAGVEDGGVEEDEGHVAGGFGGDRDFWNTDALWVL